MLEDSKWMGYDLWVCAYIIPNKDGYRIGTKLTSIAIGVLISYLNDAYRECYDK